jgi:hypothetical protein
MPIGWLAMEGMPSVVPSPSAATALPAPPVAPALTRRDHRRQRSTSWRDFPHNVRWASHGLVWIALLVPMVSELARGWRPDSDNAAIAARAYQSLSLHPPLVGMTTTLAGNEHVLFDPGPLMFYLLAAPVHLDPSRGLFWGATLLCGAVLSLAIEALWSAGLWVAGTVVAFTTLDLLWLSPNVFENLAWNAFFPLPFFVAAVVLAWVVALGRVRWWPVLVFVASVAAQSHLTFVIPSVVLTLTALIFGLHAVRLRRLGWLITGVGVGLVCWLAPLVQEVGHGPGNLSALARSNGGEAIVGFGFGLKLLGAAGSLHPLWLTHLPTAFYPLLGLEYAHAPWFGGLIIGLLLCITAVALAAGRRKLGALGAITLAAALSEIASFAVFPADSLLNLSYLINSLWVVSILIWSVVAWAAVSIGLWVWHRYGMDERPAIVAAAKPRVGRLPPVGVVLSLAVLAVLAVVGFLGIRPAATNPSDTYFMPQMAARDARAALAIEHLVKPGRVAIVVATRSGDGFLAPGTAEGVAYRLKVDGWRPGLASPLGFSSGFTIPPRQHWPTMLITLTGGSGLSVTRVR